MEEIQLDKAGSKGKTIKLSKAVFAAEVNPVLLGQYVYIHNKRSALGTKKTKGRGEVNGGGHKPWRQKGTGRARVGSARSPLWVGGGHAHPIEPVLTRRIRLSSAMRDRAFVSALSLRQMDKAFKFVEEFTLEKPSTKTMVAILKAWQAKDTVLLVGVADDLVLKKSIANLTGVRFVTTGRLSVADLLWPEVVVVIGDAYKEIEKRVQEHE